MSEMTAVIEELTSSNLSDWNDFLMNHPDGTFFHRPEWREVIAGGFKHKSYYFIAREGGQVTGILPLVHIASKLFGNRLVSQAFCVGGGILSTTPAAHAALRDKADGLMRDLGAEYVEYRAPAESDPSWSAREGLYATFDREIAESEEDCLKQIPRKQRAVLRKAFKNELEVKKERSVEPFYHLYSMGMRNLGTPVFSRKYIQLLLDCFGEDCDILTVYKDGVALSSVLNFYHGDRVMPYYTGADPMARKTGAADLMYWAVMRDALERGYKVFDFGRSKVGTGPFSFKKNWGFEPRPTQLEFSLPEGAEIPDVNPNNPKYKYFIKAWKKLPHGLANFIGPHLARHLG